MGRSGGIKGATHARRYKAQINIGDTVRLPTKEGKILTVERVDQPGFAADADVFRDKKGGAWLKDTHLGSKYIYPAQCTEFDHYHQAKVNEEGWFYCPRSG